MKNQETIAFLYKWTEKSTGMWYEGSRTASGCHPEDGYLCSSKLVREKIKTAPDDWERVVLVIGESAYIRKLETSRLKSLDAKNDIMSYNKSNAEWDAGNRKGSTDSDETRKKKSVARSGDKNPMFGKRGSLCPHFGKKHHQDRCDNISKALSSYAKNRPDLHNKNISKSLKGNKKLITASSGEKNGGFKGYYISPTGGRFDSSRKAAVSAGVKDKKTLISWAKNNKNGWSYEPKTKNS